MSADPRFPLGVPVNRSKPSDLVPVPGRPGWWKDRQGVERYIEPVKPAQPAAVSPRQIFDNMRRAQAGARFTQPESTR